MDFILDNYIWFIIGGIVIIMIVIGFFAEKTDFGKKPFGGEHKKDNSDNDHVQSFTENDIAKLRDKRINDVLEQQKDEQLIPLVEADSQNENNENNDAAQIENNEKAEVVQIESVDSLPDLELPQTDFDAHFVQPEINIDSIDEGVETDIPEVVEDDMTLNEDDVWKF